MSQFIAKSMGGMVAAIALATAFTATGVAPAQAATTPVLGTLTPLFSGGGTLAELVYRNQFNCWGSNSSDKAPDLGPVTAECSLTSTPFQPLGELLYAGVGSGNGKKAFTSHNAANLVAGSRIPDAKPQGFSGDFGPFFDTAGVYPGLSDPYPNITLAGSDDPLNATDISTYNGNGFNTSFGPPAQVPTLITSITVPFNPTADFAPNGKAATNADASSTLVDFSLNTLCGIFTGAITQWNDPAITADNGNAVLGTGQIKVTFRNDGSGTTFVFTNGLINQCGTAAHPNKFVTHPIPDSWLTANTIALGGNIVGATKAPFYLSNNNFYINVNTAGAFPAGSSFTGAKGSSGVQTAIEGTVGSVGYLSPDFAQPVAAAPAPQVANLENYKVAITNKATPVFVSPRPAAATLTMASAKVPSFSSTCINAVQPGGCATQPLNWGQVNPVPTSNISYPIAGFTFMDFYTCYGDANTTLALATDKKSYLEYYYGSTVTAPSVNAILAKNGFSPIPNSWKSAAKKLLLTNLPTKLRQGPSTGVCTGGA